MKTQYETQLGIAATVIFTATMIMAMFVASDTSITDNDKSDSPSSSYVSNTSSTTHTNIGTEKESTDFTFKK